MREQHLESIRRACVEANAEIKELRTPCLCIEHGNCPFKEHVSVGRPIRLADVLLAINKKYINGTLQKEGEFKGRIEWFGEIAWDWNCKKDNLTLQSDECLQFLASLLTDDTV